MADLDTTGYARFDHKTRTLIADGQISEEYNWIFGNFSKTALQSAFPCIGAQKVMRDFRVAFCFSPDHFNTEDAAERTCRYLYRWSEEAGYELLKQMSQPTAFATCVVVFPKMEFQGERDSELQLWEFLGKMHAYDKARHSWSGESSNFVYGNRFSMSVGGYAHFILFHSQSAITPSRRFSQPMLTFNPHFIFEAMRSAAVFE